ncbi:DUF349 domain-containing protein [Microbacterium trichothecenolyticum]|uniref:DUF349 domain-containing protein n=1 Tax=Microbacterium trichothecenolyticum TaxID=69370 RepID=A0A0M2GZX5_MICTR|nr:DUF349 domain-containing protein [Microbacterium trichothecenolyticum]KJL39706.1 hypothetical protein RS82_03907 [Microbacterium trichothecenolyticum]
MTAAADFQPETDAPETTGADEDQTPAVDDDAATATDVTADADAAVTQESDSVDEAPAGDAPDGDAPDGDAAETEQPSDDTPAEESASADVEIVEVDVVEVVEDGEVVAVEVIEVAEVVEDGEVVAVEVADVAVEAAPSADEPWGRVDEDGTVSVREADGWRVVGQYPDGSAEEALAYFERKYTDLASEVTLLEVRHRRGGASASDLRSTARTINGKLDGAAAVGDLASLVARVAALTETLAAESATEAVAAREAVDDAVKARTELVEKAEALAARDPRTVQWKQATGELNSLFDQWQSQQQNGPRLPKSTAQQLWKRFRDARATVDKHRRAFYAELDEAHKGVRDRKTRLVEKAESLAPKGEDGIPAYRELLDQWKTAGRAGKKVDDALWARFKAAGDALYGARIEREAADAEASREKIDLKRALLDEAKAVGDERDIAKARSILTGIQRRWDEIGRIFPRDTERSLDDELRRVENALRTREDADWKRNDPEQKARANDMTRQLTDAIQKLEDELEAAKKSGDKKAIANATDALEARRTWLKALGG